MESEMTLLSDAAELLKEYCKIDGDFPFLKGSFNDRATAWLKRYSELMSEK